jgi:YVTN family beta-propeller protein
VPVAYGFAPLAAPACGCTQALAMPPAYVPNENSGTISVIDTRSDSVVRTLDAGGKPGKRVRAIDARAARKSLYAVDAQHNKLFAIDPTTDAEDDVAMGVHHPGVAALLK